MRRPRTALAACLLATSLSACSGGAQPCSGTALTDRALSELDAFTGWLDRHDVRGVVGEVGWPADPRWQDVAAAWYTQAAEAGVGTYAWAGAEQWSPDYPLALYRSRGPRSAGLDLAGPQAEVVERHPGPLRGAALADGSFAASVDDPAYSSAAPGTFERDYRYPSRASLLYLAGRGVGSVRLALQWERVQPAPGGPLSPTEVERLRRVLRDADDVGLDVVLDLHSYGRYVQGGPGGRRVLLLGSPELPAGRLADVWQRLAGSLGGEPAVAGYGIMNEPHDLPGGAAAWEAASALAVTALREVDGTTPVLVGGYAHSGAAAFARHHPDPWVPDDDGPVLYEAHQYFDGDRSGAYAVAVAAEEQRAADEGWGC